jgi:hypothetical protein
MLFMQGAPLSICAMARYNRSLFDLCECFCGILPRNAHWMSLLDLANRTLTTPALKDFTSRFCGQIPNEVGLYVREMFDRNLMRNARLASQLAECVLVLNENGIIPVLFKGAVTLASPLSASWGSKLMTDLDIMVPPQQVDVALNSLFTIGYSVHFQADRDSRKWYADLKRARDVGMIDLHKCAPGPAFFYGSADDIYLHSELIPVGKGKAYVPSATYQALMLIVHDQFQDNDYWIGNIDLRHLLDLRDLAVSSKPIDWTMLISFASSELARNAMETQLLLLASLLDVEMPADIGTRIIPRLQYRRRLLQAQFPLLRYPLLTMGMLDYRNYRAGPAANEPRDGIAARGNRWLPKPATMRSLIELCGQQRAGKL